MARSPAAQVRRPRLDYESHATGLDRNEVGALLVAGGLGGAAEHALVSLLAINGLRVSEALGADIEALRLERGHRTLTILRKGGKVVTIPLAPRTARRSTSLSVSGRMARSSSTPMGSASIVTPLGGLCVASPDALGSTSQWVLHTLRHPFITALDAGVPVRDVQQVASHADPRTTMRYDRGRVSLDRHATYIVAAFIAGAAR